MSRATTSQRLTWVELPQQIQDWVTQALGAPIISAVTQQGGFSLGTADRLIANNGRRAFLKAVDAAVHPQTAALHRKEGKITSAFPVVPQHRLSSPPVIF